MCSVYLICTKCSVRCVLFRRVNTISTRNTWDLLVYVTPIIYVLCNSCVSCVPVRCVFSRHVWIHRVHEIHGIDDWTLNEWSDDLYLNHDNEWNNQPKNLFCLVVVRFICTLSFSSSNLFFWHHLDLIVDCWCCFVDFYRTCFFCMQ